MSDTESLPWSMGHAVPLRQLASWDGGLVAAKLSRPQLPPAYVDRDRLCAALDVGTSGPVTLVTAGPGWGKTLLVAAWAARAARDRAVAWVTLDADDDEPRVFWVYVLAALRGTGAVPPDNPLASLDPVGGFTTDTWRQIQAGLSQLAREIVLVIDDVAEIRSDEVHRQIARLCRHETPLRVVLVSRVEPSVALHRLRVGGGLEEITAADLAFTEEEAAEFLVGLGLRVDRDDVVKLLDRTDGWAAGLRLAAMFVHRTGAPVSDFGGVDPSVADYLLGEVIAGQSPQTWQFLLRTSLVPRICGELADTMTGQSHGQLTLDALARDNAFVTALGPERRWYRYHPLLGEMLRRQLETERPESVQGLHERACRWFAANGQPVDAVRHAVAARNWSLVGTTMTQVAMHRILTTDRHALASALAQIPAAELVRTAELQLCAAAILLIEGRYVEMEPHLLAAGSIVAEDVEASDPSTRVALALFEAAVARAHGSAGGVVRATDVALRILGAHAAAAPLALEFRAVALNNRGVGLLWLDQVDEATTSLRSGLDASAAAGLEMTLMNELGHLGLAATVTGQLRQASSWGVRCRELAEARGWADLLQAATGYLTLAFVSLARGDLDEAEHMLALGHETQRDQSEPHVLFALRYADALVGIARGRYDVARAELDLLHDDLCAVSGPSLVRRWVASARAELDLGSTRHAALRSRLEALEPAKRTDDESVLLARARLADGHVHGLDELLAPVLRHRRDLRLVVQAEVVQALAAQRLRLDEKALEAVARALAVAEPEQLVAPFTGPGTAPLRGLLERTVLLRPTRAGFAQSVLDRLRPVLAQDEPVAQITEREKTVLRYLGTMLSNAEIAEQMYLSPNTIKVHLRHLYRKLDVTSRRAAVRRARELRLLGHDESA